MIRINNITRGRFGNRILQYNSLMQIARLSDTEASCSKWEGQDFFKDLVVDKSSTNQQFPLSWKDVLNSDITSLPQDRDFHIDDPAYCLHNVFYKLTKSDAREFLKIKDIYRKNLPQEKVNVGIHFRGTDILGADGNHGREIHYPKYYADSIELVEGDFENTHYYLCTDDLTFNSFIETLQFLKDKNLNFSLGNDSDYLGDFATLSECDILISSSSTFVVSAGFIGKEDKKIIHSKDWINKNLNHEHWHKTPDTQNVRQQQISFDNFWVDLYNGGNEFYKSWRLV
jgi:hypothetical protein